MIFLLLWILLKVNYDPILNFELRNKDLFTSINTYLSAANLDTYYIKSISSRADPPPPLPTCLWLPTKPNI
jgi:hypothetical protein